MKYNSDKVISNSRDGQSLVELVVGLLAVVLLLMGILQIGRLGMKHTQTLLDGRKEADFIAGNDEFRSVDTPVGYAFGVTEGSDDRSYSQDDVVVKGNPDEIIDNVVGHADPGSLRIWMPTNSISPLENSASFMQAFDLIHTQSHSERVELYPIIRNLVADDQYIRLSHDVWMPWMRGL